jgi:uncharacterized protein
LTSPTNFSNRTRFPGETGNPLDIALFATARLEKIPFPLFALLLAVFAGLRFWYAPREAFGLAFFFFTDWFLLAALPLAKRSFGPARPPTLILAVMRLVFSIFPFPVWLMLQIAGTLLVLYGFWMEPVNLTITHQKLTSSKLTPSARPLRLLHLGDLHIEKIGLRETRLNALIQQMHPDVIVFSGDFLNLSYREDPAAVQAARQVIAQWNAPLGVYAVTGSPAVDYPEIVAEILTGLPVRWLKNETVTLSYEGDQINLIGITCSHRPHLDTPLLSSLDFDQNKLNILLYHTPDLAPEAARLGIDLQLSGHTHGGQVRLPGYGALLTGLLYGKRFEAGRYQLDRLVLYVSRGLGLEGAGAPRVRFLCPPELVLWEISAN